MTRSTTASGTSPPAPDTGGRSRRKGSSAAKLNACADERAARRLASTSASDCGKLRCTFPSIGLLRRGLPAARGRRGLRGDLLLNVAAADEVAHLLKREGFALEVDVDLAGQIDVHLGGRLGILVLRGRDLEVAPLALPLDRGREPAPEAG